MAKASDEFVRQLNNSTTRFNLDNGNVSRPRIQLNIHHSFADDTFKAESGGKLVLSATSKTEFATGIDALYAMTETQWNKKVNDAPLFNQQNNDPAMP